MAKTKEETKPEVAKEEPKVDDTVEKLKVKPKTKKFVKKDGDDTIKIDLKELAAKAEDVVKVDLKDPKIEEVKQVEEVKEPKKEEVKETPVLQEVKESEVVKEPIKVPEPPKIELPENVQKLMDFMSDTGGNINDYVELNRDYSELDNDTLLREYYNKIKPHLEKKYHLS